MPTLLLMFTLVLHSLYSLVFKLFFPFSNMFLSPLFYVPLFSEYGKNMVITVEKHFFPDPRRQQTSVNRSLTNGKKPSMMCCSGRRMICPKHLRENWLGYSYRMVPVKTSTTHQPFSLPNALLYC